MIRSASGSSWPPGRRRGVPLLRITEILPFALRTGASRYSLYRLPQRKEHSMSRFELDGATAIVTGASRGIGPHIAAALSGRGARVALVARSTHELDSVVSDPTEAGGKALAIVADVTSSDQRVALIAE